MNALISSGIVVAVAGSYGKLNELEVPLPIYAQVGAVMAASKIVADQAVHDRVERAMLSGALFAGASWIVFGDTSWLLNGGLGAASSYAADVFTS